MRLIYKFIYFKILKWTIIGDFPKHLKKYIVIAAPHTHWQDFPMGIMLRKILHTKINFVAKKELFKWPLGWYLKKVGGHSLDRTEGQNKVEAYAELFKKNDYFVLNIAPEGTRKKVENWKSGFYYIALKAKVPIVMVVFDFGKKEHRISDPFYPTGDFDKDIVLIKSFFKGAIGRVPEYS